MWRALLAAMTLCGGAACTGGAANGSPLASPMVAAPDVVVAAPEPGVASLAGPADMMRPRTASVIDAPPRDGGIAAVALPRPRPPQVAPAARAAQRRAPALAPLGGGRVRSAAEYFATLDRRFRPEAARGLHAVIQFDLSGPQAAAYHVAIDDGVMTLTEGHVDQATVTFAASAEDYVRVVNGELGGVSAVLRRKLKVDGSIALARRMQRMFPGGQPDGGDRAPPAQVADHEGALEGHLSDNK